MKLILGLTALLAAAVFAANTAPAGIPVVFSDVTAPAGIKFDNTGHHHLLIDTDQSELKLDAPLPSSDKIVHFGKGQTETTLMLTPGKHTLELLFADYQHLSFNPPLHSKKITITVD